MIRILLKSKIHGATLTDANLYYRGSITIDEIIMQKANIIAGERVDVLNVNNGTRLQTYVIKGKTKSGVICLNGPSARLGHAGDTIMILSYGLYTAAETKRHTACIIELDGKNKIKNSHLA